MGWAILSCLSQLATLGRSALLGVGEGLTCAGDRRGSRVYNTQEALREAAGGPDA